MLEIWKSSLEFLTFQRLGQGNFPIMSSNQWRGIVSSQDKANCLVSIDATGLSMPVLPFLFSDHLL